MNNSTEYTAWESRGRELSTQTRRVQFAIADWLLEGVGLCAVASDAYDAAERLFPQYHRQTFITWVTVARHFPASTRIESEFLTFKHYQVVQGSEDVIDSYTGDRGDDYRRQQLALQLVWLRKADEQHMSASVLCEAIANAGRLRQRASEPPEPVEPESVEPEPKPAPKPTKLSKWERERACYDSMPPWLCDQRVLWGVRELAKARQCKPYELVVRAVAEFIDAHADELGDARVARDKRQAEYKASVLAAQQAEQERIRLIEASPEYQRRQAEQAERDKRQAEHKASVLAAQQAEQERRELEQAERTAEYKAFVAMRKSCSKTFPDDEPGFAV
jgi:hypothetical protein